MMQATGDSERSEVGGSKLNRVYQLTGFSDPIYAEAYVSVHRYDIVLGTSRKQLPHPSCVVIGALVVLPCDWRVICVDGADHIAQT